MEKNHHNRGKVFEHVKGTVDWFPPQSLLFGKIMSDAADLFRIYGYEEINLPLLEEQGVFIKSVGETTDIVEKQMFKIEGRDIILRPEGTAQVVRFFIEKSLHKQKDLHKFFYLGPMFRGERPQKGRLRQFHHLGCEVFGSASPYADAEVIMLARAILERCKAKDVYLRLNSLGCDEDKKRLVTFLKSRLAEKKSSLCELCQRRIEKNPLRVLDCKSRDCRKAVAGLNLGKEILCHTCRSHFEKVCALLETFSLPYTYDPFLVRGLDYYTNTVFEFTASGLGAQDACGAGGRYNSLVRRMGGPDVPALGFALGLERLMLLCDQPVLPAPAAVYVAYTPDTMIEHAFKFTSFLRQQGISADCSLTPKSLKAQLRIAEKSKVLAVILVGEDELKEGCLVVRNMRQSTQEKIACDQLVPVVRQLLNV